jgi:MFS family permease
MTDVNGFEQVVAQHARRNFVLNVLEGGIFMFGYNMVSNYTVLPYFVQQYTQESWVQGLIPAIGSTGWLLPGLFVAPLIAHMWTRKAPMLVLTFFERIPWLFIGLWLFIGNPFDTTTTLAVFFSLYALHTFSAGATAVPWQDFISRVIPNKLWGTFFGMQSGLGSLLGVAGASLATQVLANKPIAIGAWEIVPAMAFPNNVGFLALTCFACMVISYVFVIISVEPPHPPQERQPFWHLIQQAPTLLRTNREFTRYLVAVVLIGIGMMGQSFVTAAALSKFEVSGSTVGTFTIVLLLAQAIGNFGLGALSDRWGHKRIMVLTAVMVSAGLLVAWFAPAVEWFYLVFALGGIALGGNMPASFAMVFTFATAETRAAYIAIANTFNVPVAAGAPLIAGWIAGQLGYPTLFVILAVFGLLGAATMKWFVRTPTLMHAPVEA